MGNRSALARWLSSRARPHLEAPWRRVAPRLRRALGLGHTEARVAELDERVRRIEARITALEDDARALAALIPTFFEEARAAGRRP